MYLYWSVYGTLYLHVYHHLHQSTPFESCGAVPRKGEEIRQHCPAPKTITDYLNHISTDPVKLNATNTICVFPSCRQTGETVVMGGSGDTVTQSYQ